MPIILESPSASGGGSGTVTSVTAADTSIVIAGTAVAPTVATATLDVIAADHPAAANWSNNSKKITALANGSAAQDALAFGQVFAAGAIPIADLADPGTGKVIGSSGGAATAVNPPGFEFGYDQITATVSVTSTTESSGTTVITCSAHTFDGGLVVAHFQATGVYAGAAANAATTVCLFEGVTEIGRLVSTFSGNGNQTFGGGAGEIRFTPSAGSHTYTVTAFRAAANGQIIAGAGGTAAEAPAFIRFIKV